jgi:hypothetical protein
MLESNKKFYVKAPSTEKEVYLLGQQFNTPDPLIIVPLAVEKIISFLYVVRTQT